MNIDLIIEVLEHHYKMVQYENRRAMYSEWESDLREAELALEEARKLKAVTITDETNRRTVAQDMGRRM